MKAGCPTLRVNNDFIRLGFVAESNLEITRKDQMLVVNGNQIPCCTLEEILLAREN